MTFVADVWHCSPLTGSWDFDMIIGRQLSLLIMFTNIVLLTTFCESLATYVWAIAGFRGSKLQIQICTEIIVQQYYNWRWCLQVLLNESKLHRCYYWTLVIEDNRDVSKKIMNVVLTLIVEVKAHLYARQLTDLVRSPVFPISRPSVFVTALSISCPEGFPPTHTLTRTRGRLVRVAASRSQLLRWFLTTESRSERINFVYMSTLVFVFLASTLKFP